ncbi:MAG: glycosyltransferase, partial [Chloroflexi bacterium]|nr:glycosyltransferase [Chloroflexota bacterium]
MKVLLIAGEFPPMEGGVGDYTRLLGDALTAAGSADAPIDVHVLTSVRATADPLAPVDATGVTRHTRLESWGFVPLYGAVDQLLRAVAPDVVHIQYQSACYGLHPAINLLPLRLRRRGVPCVTTFHDLLTPYLFPKAGPLRWRSVREMARASAAVIVTNVADELRLLQEGGVARLVRIPIGSNVPRVLPAGYDRAAWRRRWGAP